MSDYDKYLLVPQYSSMSSRNETSTVTHIASDLPISIPYIASPMSSVCEESMARAMRIMGSVGIVHRYLTEENQCNIVKSLVINQRTIIGASVGVNGNHVKRAEKLVHAGANLIVLDLAHGDSQNAYDFVRHCKRTFGDEVKIMSGNIVTRAAAERYVDAGADALRVGIGSGSSCATRTVAGVGRNQIEAIADISGCGLVVDDKIIIKEKSKLNIPIIGDGGIKTSGDAMKSLAAGASAVIIGGLLAPAIESPAQRLQVNGEKKVIYAGMASTYAEEERIKRTNETSSNVDHIKAPEGNVVYLPDENKHANEIISPLVGGIRHGLAYIGAKNIEECWSKAVWTRA